MKKYSFLLPTRERPDLLRRFLESVRENTDRPDELEIIIAADDDDEASQNFHFEGLEIKKVVLPRGATMGTLNTTCYEACCGRFIMLVNDDIIVRTPHWDSQVGEVLAEYPDEIVLVHVNDLLFREKLCTFPMLSRRACEAIGLCPDVYQRYRIDDHIYDTYSLLAFLGHKRIIYLPDVIFEHDNHEQQAESGDVHTFQSIDKKIYRPNQKIIDQDARLYDDRNVERKSNAIILARMIDVRRRKLLEASRRSVEEQLRLIEEARLARGYEALLETFEDTRYCRRKDLVKQRQTSDSHQHFSRQRTTIAVVSGDIRKPYAQRCLALLKEHTANYDLMILDNGGGGDFRHSREMNRAIRPTETDYLVLLDDDVYVEAGWLDGLLACMDEKTAVVAPLHVDDSGALSFSGVYLSGDGRGSHEHLFDRMPSPRPTQVCCSACILIDMGKVGHILMDEAYAKYFFDIVHSLQIWEAGYQVMVTPDVIVTHLGGATMVRGTEEAQALWERDRRLFIREWTDTGRLKGVEDGIWQDYPELKILVSHARRLDRLMEHVLSRGYEELKQELALLVADVKPFPQFLMRMIEEFKRTIPALLEQGNKKKAQELSSLLSALMSMVGTQATLGFYTSLADRLTQRGKFDSAHDVLEEGLKIEPDSPNLLKRMGVNSYLRGSLDKSELSFRRALERAPRDMEVLTSLGRVYSEQEVYEEAMRYLHLATRCGTPDLEAWTRLAIAAGHCQRDDILEEVRAQARTAPRLAERLESLGILALRPSDS